MAWAGSSGSAIVMPYDLGALNATAGTSPQWPLPPGWRSSGLATTSPRLSGFVCPRRCRQKFPFRCLHPLGLVCLPYLEREPTGADACGQPVGAFLAPKWPRNCYGPVVELCLSFCVRSLGEVLVRPFSAEGWGDDRGRRTFGGTSTSEAGADDWPSDVGGSESPTSPAACERQDHDPAR